MSWCIALLVTSAISAVTSQPRPDVGIPANNTRGEAVINSMLSGDGVPSSNILNIIGAGDAGGATHTGMAGPAGPMKKFTLPQVQAMVAGMNNGFRYKYDGTVSNNVADTTISKDQLLAMRDQLQGTGSASGTKEFTIDEIRMMIDGINNGLYYNRQGQVTTLESGEPLYTVGDLRDLLSKQEALEQVLQRFTLEDVRRMVQGMESGLRYNHQGMIASEGQNILPLSRLRSHLRTLEALGGSPNRPTDIPIMPGTGGGEPDTGIQQTADFTLADLERMKLGIANGLEYNFQGQMALPGQARLTAGRIDELLAKLAAKGPMGGGSQSTNFTIGDVNRMLRGMDQGYFYNFQGLQATGSEERLTRGYLQRLLNQLSPSKGIGGAMETASFTLEDVNRMLNGMDSGKSYNYDGMEARFGERALTRKQLEQFMADLKRKGMGGMMTTPSFTLEDINRMLTGMDNGLTYNYNGLEALAGEQPLTRKQLNDFKAELERKGMGGMITTPSFTLQDIDRMLTGMNNGLTYNYQGVEAMAGEKPLTRQDLIQFKDDLKRKGMGGMITTPAFTLQDIDRMLTGMNNGLTYNYQGVEAMAGEKPLTRQDLIQFKDDLKRKGMGGMITTPSFTLQDIDRMLTGMNNGLTYNYQGVEAMAGEKPLTRQDLIQFKDDLKRKGMGGELGTASFTMDDIFRMLAGMDNGISYNYQGLEAKKDEKTLTRKQLEKLMTQIRNKGKLGDPTQTAQFTVSDLERMTAGMKQGQKFNYAGLPAAVGDPTLSSHDLDRLLSQLTSSAGLKGSIDGSSTSTSTNESSSGQISGIGEGGKKIEANFSSETSQTDSSSETVITIVSGGGQGSNIIDLNPVVKGGQDILQHPFTAREIRKLMEGIRQGFTYNKQGAIAKQGEEPLTMNELSKYLSNAKTKDETGFEIPASRFTKDEIIRMKDDIKNGQSYNYEGLPAVSGEKILTIQQLDRLLERLSVTGVEPDIPTSRFTRQEINKMINDINRGISYNYYGKTPVGDEKKLTVAVLNKLLRRLDSSGADLDIPISRFTREQILRMIDDINRGTLYNYNGLTPVGNEKTLTVDVLNRLLQRLDGTGGEGGEPLIPASRFTRQEINRMINDINRGISYNYYGKTPIGGEKKLTVAVLNKLLQRLDSSGGEGGEPFIPTSRFTRQEINRMINDINRGIPYNYYGKTPVGGEKKLTVAVLNKLLRRLDGTGREQDIPISRFTREQINKMIDDISRGISYNYNGLRPIGNEKTLTVDVLNRLLQRLDGTVGEPDIPTSRFTRQEINRMINDINGGISYNYYGKTPVGGEKTLTVAVLNKLLRRLDGTGGEPDIPISRFTREQINKMIDDINRGISYNYNGLRPIGNEKTLTVDVLNRLLQRLDGTGGEPDIPISRFTREQINKMIDDINRGISYNYNGLRPIGNEKTLTVDVLNRLLQRLDGTVGEPDIPTSRFTRQEINRMINDINGGISYNYYGKTPVGGEKTLTIAVLNKLLRRLDGTGGEPDIPISRFTREQINKMIDDINRGISYNYNGLRPIGNEKTLTVDVLNRLLQRLDGTVGEPDIPTSRFTRQEINRMINDINGGISYNYYGKTPVGGEKTLTVAVLNKLLRRLDGTGGEPDIPISRFTREQINKMIDDINRGISYNYNGLRPIGNEKTLTVDVLNRLLQRLDGTVGEPDIPTSRFTRQEINRMINDINGGISYNYYGKTPVGGEKTLTVAVLNKLLRRLDGTGVEPDIPISRFTREQINKMIDDINRGLSYNYNGLRPIGNEKTLTVDVLNRLLQRLDGTVGEPDIPTSRFTRQEINRMINDINGGISYNYYGKTPVGGEKTLTVAVLNKLLRRLDGTGVEPDIPISRFTREQINKMIDDISRGISYNYNGLRPIGNEKTLTVDVLNRLLQRLDGTVGEPDIPSSRFTRQEINRMINDINGGISYNYYGKTPVGGEKTLTVAVLNKLLRRLDGTGGEPDIPISRFTREQINKMIDDINRGISYNYNGLRPIGNEKTLTVDVLNRLLQRLDGTVGEPDIPTSRFTRQEINRMINDINRGISYNYYGKTPVGGEKKLTVAVLNKLLRRLDGTAGEPDIPTSRFTRQEINRMINDINRGISYNYYGKTPVGGEKKLTVAILNNLLRTLDGTVGEPDIPTSRFTRQEINRMINDINRGISYNYYGKTPVGGEKKLTVAVLNKLLRRLDGTGVEPDIPTSRFTRQEINRMINDINRGISYNYYGKTPVGGEKKLTVDVLNKLLRRLDGTVGEPDIPTSRFTRQEINRMINDINRGISYNYYGKTPVGGEKKLTVAVLNKLLRTLDGTVGEPDIPTSRFTRQEINRMINDINRGISYNYYGKTPVGSEKKLTVAVLNNLLRRLDGTVGEPDIPTSRFTRQEINRMINDINRGISYNYYGKTPVGGEKKLTVAVLNKLLRTLDGTVGEPDIPTSRFTRQEINRMINDINRGISYNYYGKTPVGSEKKLTVAVLNNLLRRLDGTVGEPDIPTSRFTRQEINRMINDINRGISYNYYGKTPVGGEKKLTVDVLNKLLRRLDGTVGEQDIPTSRFTRQEINRMINDINRGISYNYYGKTPVGSEKKLTVAVLNNLLRRLDGTVGEPDIPTSRFTRQEINRMINDINRGISYNYYGKTPVGSEKKLTVAVLNNLLRRLDGTGGQKRFTLDDINRMLEGLGKGEAYNTEGKTATGGEPTLTIGELKQIGKDLVGATPPQPLDRNFTFDEINRMLDGMDGGKNYNYQGRESGPGEAALTRDQLTRSLVTSLMPNYNIQDVYNMLRGMDTGTLYNYQGNVAAQGDRTWLKDQLQLLLVYLLGLRYENVAENKPAEISSVYDPVWTGDKGVDGNRNQNMFYDSCFHTRFEQDPYFMVDLGAVYDLDTIVVFNRQDCCENRANNLEISTGLSQYNMTVQDVIPDPIGSIGMKRFMQKPSARYVKIQKKDMNPGYLHLCEVEVYGTYNREDICNTSPCLNGGTCTNIPGYLCICATGWTGSRCHISTDNIAYGKRTEMSSLYQYNNMFSGDRGVDGNTSGILEQGVGNTCFHTDKERRPYWKVDLGAVYDLQRIVLHNRLDCCTDRAHDIEILVGLTNDDLTPIYYQPGNLGPMKEINVPYGTEGQFVMIHIKDLRPEYLHLCEVEIYGNFLRKDRCTKNPCRNGGTCTNKAGSAICNCPPGWGGIFCMRDESQTGTTYPTVTDAPEPPHWNGSRVDSAICRRAKCNLPICYLPYANDCKSYVVCQRTAIGTYVAWKMRCAFGSYWGTGTTWTCERVEDLAKRGYTCPNDPCADGTLTRYADQEIKNCRTYWYCENGVSKPACCPPGKRFDEYSLLCVDDPQEICRKPCPLKRDGCAITGARTMPFYDGNCRSYWNCEGGHAHPVCCRSGMSYDVAKGHCKQDPTCTDHCPSEYTAKACGKITKPGERPVQSYALADGNCRTYMKCSDKGYDDPFCCRQNFYYDVTTAKCEIVMNELDVCRSERCPRGYKEECRFTSVEGSPTQFYDTDALVVRDCAPSTHFAPDICTCDGSSLTNECKAEVWTKFDHLDDKWSVKNYGDGWISVFGEMSKNRSDQGVTYGTFDGSSGMEVWRYDHTAFPEATLEITFQPVASGIDKQILVSNCMSVDNGQASFEVSLDPRTSEIVFRGKSKFDSAELRLTYNKQGWNTFKLFFDGDHVVVLIEDPTGRGKTEKKFAYLRGDIVAGVGALKFGPCLDSFSMPQNNGFTGFVSEVLFSKCIDRKSRKFVRDNIVPEKRYGNALN
ncbi:uncharacterized protein LOC123532644 isoform X6 [Mercenaria mercenaria]|uniref:uncharacterized protein LOC123532644 isoform X6 n=1 Tax=Mercenaria mercenaria TaxID=6596 RepID=UPI00234F9F67|nr:uncharacterized protein LOC123532644 isoform X6 [Mercenaria mercenaria]